MPKKEQIRRLKKLVEKWGIDTDLIDFESVVDGSLSYDENRRIIEEFCKYLNSEKVLEERVKGQLDYYEHFDKEMAKKEEEHYKKEFEQKLKEIKENDIKAYIEFQEGLLDKIQESGGSLSHHHGVGRMIAKWMPEHLGENQMNVLRALKKHFDPNNIMNPGKQLIGE